MKEIMDSLRDEFTYQLLVDSGIKEGMRVLDVGCGTGDVSFLVAELVGATGEVVGVDTSMAALNVAMSRVCDVSISVKFLQMDIHELPESLGSFDAVIGRRVLMYQSNPLESVRMLLSYLKMNGKMIFQESDSMAFSLCSDSMPLHKRVQGWIWETVESEGGDVHMGMKLYALLKDAGLKVTLLRSEANLQTCESGSDLGWVAKMMESRIISCGVAGSDEMGVESLEERLRVELESSDVPFIRDMVFGVCAEKIFE